MDDGLWWLQDRCLHEITGEIRIKGICGASRKATEIMWNEYVSRYHYLGYKKPFGYVLRYFIVSEQGFLGCLMFAGAAKALAVRDRWIGWTQIQRLKNLAWVINKGLVRKGRTYTTTPKFYT